jgi:hypothetical protein
VTFLAPPVRGLGREDAQSVAYVDDQRTLELWEALRHNAAPDYARLHPSNSSGATPPCAQRRLAVFPAVPHTGLRKSVDGH